MNDNESLTVLEMAELGKLIEEHRTKLFEMIQRRLDPILATRIDADDILSEAFILARRKWRRFRMQRSMSEYAWLYRIVLDCLINAWRRETRSMRDPRRNMPWPERSSLQLGMSLVNPATSPSRALERQELQARIRQIMDQLGHRDQEILWMRHFDNFSFNDISSVLGISQNAAAVRYARALRRLKDLWASHSGNGSG